MNRQTGIYTIENTANGHRYIGSAMNAPRRWQQHLGYLRKGTHHSPHLQNAWNKYGEGAFRFEVLEEWEPEFLVGMEQWWINMLQPEYNICPTAGSRLGCRLTAATRQRLSAAGMGKKPSAESRAKQSAARKGKPTWNKGIKATPQHVAKLSASRAGKPWTEARRLACTPEYVANQSASHAGHKNTPATRAKMSATHTGMRHSAETRAKQSAARKRWWAKKK